MLINLLTNSQMINWCSPLINEKCLESSALVKVNIDITFLAEILNKHFELLILFSM